MLKKPGLLKNVRSLRLLLYSSVILLRNLMPEKNYQVGRQSWIEPFENELFGDVDGRIQLFVVAFFDVFVIIVVIVFVFVRVLVKIL